MIDNLQSVPQPEKDHFKHVKIYNKYEAHQRKAFEAYLSNLSIVMLF